jgi:Concanavalin A-like lectin/glucanases superfamily
MSIAPVSRTFRSLFTVLCLLLMPAALHSQPFNIWLLLSGDGSLDSSNGYSQVASNPALNPSSAITLEGWVQMTSDGGAQECRSFIGKNYRSAYWVGFCGGTLRSYLRGGFSDHKDGGVVPLGEWTHFAVTFDGSARRHYINGELIATFAETAPLPATNDPLQIGGDVSWEYSPNGGLSEFRLWNIALSEAEIRSLINVSITTPQPGLVAVWKDGQHDALHNFDGTLHGNAFLDSFAAISNCGSSTATTLCLLGHYAVSTVFRVGPPGSAESQAGVSVSSDSSGIFWFFAADNWEVTVKMVDGCPVNNFNWTFLTSDTSLFYRTTVTDVQGSGQKIYFNYPSLTPFSILDTSSMPCP